MSWGLIWQQRFFFGELRKRTRFEGGRDAGRALRAVCCISLVALFAADGGRNRHGFHGSSRIVTDKRKRAYLRTSVKSVANIPDLFRPATEQQCAVGSAEAERV
jgi:hypothetical protein